MVKNFNGICLDFNGICLVLNGNSILSMCTTKHICYFRNVRTMLFLCKYACKIFKSQCLRKNNKKTNQT